MNEQIWTLLIAAAPTLLLGMGWLLKKAITYKDGEVQAVLGELEDANDENKQLNEQLKLKDGKLTEYQLRHMLAEERIRSLQEENERLRRNSA